MDPFMERMIARANLRSRRGDKQDHNFPTSSEEKILRRSYRTDASSPRNFQNANIEPIYSKESIPIRSPRKFILNEATIKKSCENKASAMQPGMVMSEECPGFMKSRGLFSKGSSEKDAMSLHATEKLGSNKGKIFIPEAMSTPILKRGNIVNKNLGISCTIKSPGNEESKIIYPCLSKCSDNVLAMKNVNVAYCRNAFEEMNNNLAPIIPSNIKQEFRNQFTFSGGNENAQAFHTSKNGLAYHKEERNTCNALEIIQPIEDYLEEDANFCVDEMNSKVLPQKSTSEVADDVKMTFQVSGRVNLEDLDDMEDRVSELEIKVNGLKINEITVPGIKQAQIMTEILPLGYTQEMKGGNDKAAIRNKSNDAKENSPKKLYISQSIENSKDKHSSIYKSLKESNDCKNLSCDEHILNVHLDESNNSNQRYSIVVNTSETDTANLSKNNIDTLTESSHDDHSGYSIHSGDFSFSCSCSTSISQSSFHHRIPNESLPFLILQNLSYNRKGQSNIREPKPSQIINTAENIDSAIQCDSYNEEGSRKECSLKELKVNQLHRKVTIESTTMVQASKALSLCYSSLIFSGSPQQIEGERLLLLSTLRKQAFLDEIRRLEAQKYKLLQQTESIEIKIERIRLHLMEDFLSKITSSKQQYCYHFMCIVSHKESVLSSDVILAHPDQPSIEFLLKNFKIEGQFCDDFPLCLRVYTLKVSRSVAERGKTKLFARRTYENKENISLVNCHPPFVCSCKAGDSETKQNFLNGEDKEQSVIRVPSFVLTARTELSLPKDLNKISLQLEQYEPFCCNGNHFKILQDTASLNLTSTLKTTRCDSTIDKYISKEHQGFLARFSIISGNGAWQREWWCLKGTFLLSWKYPEDEDYLPPIRVIDLKLSADKILPVPRRKCARSNTFLIIQNEESNCRSEDQESTHVWDEKKTSTAEHILSADSREEMDNWCKKLNGVLHLLESWRVIPIFFQKQ